MHSDNEMHVARKVNWGRIGSVLPALGTLSAGLAVSVAPWGPWSTAFLLVAPAVPAGMLWRAVDPPARLVLAGVAAVVVDAVVAEVMLATGTWSLPNGITAVAVVSALMWVGNTVTHGGCTDPVTSRSTRTAGRSGAEVVAKLDESQPAVGLRRLWRHRSSRERTS